MSFVIPYFIPHQGCPHQCLFCNQERITGVRNILDQQVHAEIAEEIEKTIREWLAYRKGEGKTQFAFYGGSFTCLSEELQNRMLHAVQPWIKEEKIHEIRLSTRPDCIDEAVCANLVTHNVSTVELGVQSLDDTVLSLSRRGHTVEDCVQAVTSLKKAGLACGIQLMPGLPGESRYSFIQTVKRVIGLQPQCVRLYPALVVQNSGLEETYRDGGYTPLSLTKAIAMVGYARKKFLQAGIQVIRMGLQPSEALEKSVIAGPYHPSFGELVISRDWLKRVRKLLVENSGRKVEITISDRDLSAFNGMNKENRIRFRQLGLAHRFQVVLDKHMERGKMHHVVCESA